MVAAILWSCAITKMERHRLIRTIRGSQVTGQLTCTLSILSQSNIIRHEILEGLSNIWGFAWSGNFEQRRSSGSVTKSLLPVVSRTKMAGLGSGPHCG